MPTKTKVRRAQSDLVDLIAVKQALANSMKTRRITVAGLAKQLHTGRTAIRRTLDAKNTSTTFKTIQRTANALGFAVRLEARPLSPEELGALAHRMVKAKTVEEGDHLEAELVKGFFGDAKSSA